jgi:hypothetical protein
MICRNWCGVSAWLIVLSNAACGNEETTRVEVYENSGSLCLTQEGSQITVDARIDACLQGACRSSSRPPSCQASFTSGRLVITSTVEVTIDSSPPDCLAACFDAEATCAVTVPQEGEVVVVHGDEQMTVNLPLASATPLFERSTNPCPEE